MDKTEQERARELAVIRTECIMQDLEKLPRVRVDDTGWDHDKDGDFIRLDDLQAVIKKWEAFK